MRSAQKQYKLEKVTINDALPLKAARHDVTAKLKTFWGFESWLQTNLLSFHLESPWDATLMPLKACVMDCGRNTIRRVGKHSGPILSLLKTKVHKIFRRCREPIVFSNALARLSMSCFVQKIFATKSRSRRKSEQMWKFLAPNFCGDDPNFLR